MSLRSLLLTRLRDATKITAISLENKRRRNILVSSGRIQSKACALTTLQSKESRKQKTLVSNQFAFKMSVRRPTRRTRRGTRLSGSDSLPWPLDIQNQNSENNDSAEVAATEQIQSNQNTPAPKMAANEMGDIESSASKRMPLRSNTPAQLNVSAASESQARTENVNPSPKHLISAEAFKRLETFIEKLDKTAPLLAANATNAPTREVEKSLSDHSTDELMEEMLQRLQTMSNRTEINRRTMPVERNQNVVDTMSTLLSKMRDERNTQQNVQTANAGRVITPDEAESESVEQAQASTSSNEQSLYNAARSKLGRKSFPSTVISEENVDEADDGFTINFPPNCGGNKARSLFAQPSSGNISAQDRAHNDQLVRRITEEIRNEERARKRQRSPSPERRKRRRSREESKEDDKIVIPQFDGRDWPAFKSVFESVAAHKKWKPEFKALQLKCQITGKARKDLNVVDSSNWTYDQLVEHFEIRHGKCRTKVEVMTDLDKLSRKPDQSLTSWRDEVITIANSGRLTVNQYHQLTHYTFLRGLGTYPQMLHWVTERDTGDTLQSCYEVAKRYEREIGTPGLVATRPTRVAAVSTETSNPAPSVSEVQACGVSASSRDTKHNPALEDMIKTNKEANELVEKLKKELEQVKKRNNFRWRGGRGRGRGNQGKGSFQFGKKPGSYHAHPCNVEPEELERRIAAEECAAYNAEKSKKSE